ncbi:phosphatidate cytidylyltransferase [Labrenzia sp. OB1]|uniref:phosphatidate cytidylyltransferase n=1 Tax=Labrenzia sp. OB1 TaxID=1561204 RepID=UPI0007B28FDB|nr:phosphatidate cytidylyltransferase [Labrenzia sp. OB1]KZM48003.1 phosphatidate cytidylyltransferase [Labrenzia sp. OB1]
MADPHPPSKKLSDLGLRFASAVILGPLVLLIAWLGGLPYAALVLTAAVLFLWEWFSITGTRQISPLALVGQGALVVLALCHVTGHAEIGLAAILVAAFAAFGLGRFSRAGRWSAEGILYSGCALFALLAIREGTGGLLFTFFLLFVVWATDIFAYFTGRALGGPKLWARVSPKKTWSGAVGGLMLAAAFGVGVVVVAGAWAGPEAKPEAGLGDANRNLWIWALLAAALSIVSQAGDLLESAVKRRFDVKDSSRLIPGHGGIMDRIDGLVAAAIFAVLIGVIAGGTLGDPIAGLGLH